MKFVILQRFKQLLTIIGARLSAPTLHQFHMVVNYMKLGRWMVKHGYDVRQRCPYRPEVFDTVAERVRDQRVLYLEFGVYQGVSMRYWSEALKHPEAMLHGFDSFIGLPEDFDYEGRYSKGTYDVGGAIPKIDDPRVTFYKGWFEEVLPTYEIPDYEILIIMLDANIYSATQYVLEHFREVIKPGTYVYLDDMSRPDHEPKAFEEFMEETGRKFRLVSTDYSLNFTFFQCVA